MNEGGLQRYTCEYAYLGHCGWILNAIVGEDAATGAGHMALTVLEYY